MHYQLISHSGGERISLCLGHQEAAGNQQTTSGHPESTNNRHHIRASRVPKPTVQRESDKPWREKKN
jgi:hypothetical protein